MSPPHRVTLRALYQLPAYYLTLLFFGVGALEICLVGLLTGWWPASERSERFFQWLIHRHLALLHGWCALTRLIHVRYHGFDAWPEGGLVLAANHPALSDVTCLLARMPGAVFIFKPALRHNPLLAAAARRAGHLGSDGGPGLLRDAVKKLAAGHTLVVFPEGTRTSPGQPVLPFKGGFVLFARQARVPIQLVRITTDSDLLTKGWVWWRLPKLPARIELTAGPRVATDTDASSAALTAEIEAWFRAPASR